MSNAQRHYVPSIDGLRAVAVIAVVAFHAFPLYVTGGFVGVDVFFVISGYLISGIIRRGLEQGTFTFHDFYARRIKRIFPALTVVLAASAMLGYLFLFRSEFRNLGKHITFGALFSSNFAFWLDTGYFDVNADRKPLLHLWSLGVEEQFYFAWPLFLYLAFKRSWKTVAAIFAVGAVSFLLSIWGTSAKPIAAFFLPVTRCWELMVGSSIAYAANQLDAYARFAGGLNTARFRNAMCNGAAILGMALIGVAIFGLDQTSTFPGWSALLPTLGTALVIAAGPAAWVSKVVLASRPLVYVGLISYPLYLWHWPMLSFMRIVYMGPLPVQITLCVIGVAFLLSWLTYEFIEKPIRFGARTFRWTVPTLCVALGLQAAIGLCAYFQVMQSRLDTPLTAKIDRAIGDWDYPGAEFNFKRSSNFRFLSRAGSHGGKVIFIGDSHIEQYWGRVEALLADGRLSTKSVIFATSPGCPPVPDANRTDAGYACDKFFAHALREAMDGSIDTVVFGAAWEAYFPPRRPAGNGPLNPIYYVHDESKMPLNVDSSNTDIIFEALRRQIESLREAGKHVYIILPNATSPAFSPTSMQPSRLGSGDVTRVQPSISRTEFANGIRSIVDRLRLLADGTGAVVIDPLEYFCDAALCRTVTQDGTPLYSDSNHMRPFFVREKATFVDRMVVD